MGGRTLLALASYKEEYSLFEVLKNFSPSTKELRNVSELYICL